MPALHEGGCLCGAVRYRLHAEPLTLYACHCTDCQRHGGGAFGLTMLVPRDALEIAQGDPGTYAVELADGRQKRGRFCATCATRLWGEPASAAQIAALRPGTLDDTSWLEPIAHIWTRSRQRWVPLPAPVRGYERQPEPIELIRAWHERSAAGAE